jgi:hypothetical protein
MADHSDRPRVGWTEDRLKDAGDLHLAESALYLPMAKVQGRTRQIVMLLPSKPTVEVIDELA